MKKIVNFILAIVFTLSIALAVINSAAANKSMDAKSAYATICPIPPPMSPSENRKKNG